MKYSSCIDMMFSYTDFYSRFGEAKKYGIDTVEFWKWNDRDIDLIGSLLKENKQEVSVFNLCSGDSRLTTELLRGILNQDRAGELVSALRESIPIYRKLRASGLIVLIGETLSMPYEEQLENIVKSLEAAACVAEEENITLLIEPLNSFDRKNYFMPKARDVIEIIRRVGSDRIKLLFDIYHEQLMEGNIINAIKENIDVIGHFHVADVPGRHEPGTGEINYKNILSAIKSTGYSGYVGLEYRATKPDGETLGFMTELRLRHRENT